jgi:hypothetical protein
MEFSEVAYVCPTHYSQTLTKISKIDNKNKVAYVVPDKTTTD